MSFWVDCAAAGQMMEFEPDCNGCMVALRKRANEVMGISGDPEDIREMVGKLLEYIKKSEGKTVGLDAEIIWAVTEAGTFFTSRRGDPTWDTREMRERVFDRVNELLEEKRLRQLAASVEGRTGAFFPGGTRTDAYTSGVGLDDQIDADNWYAAELERTKDRGPA